MWHKILSLRDPAEAVSMLVSEGLMIGWLVGWMAACTMCHVPCPLCFVLLTISKEPGPALLRLQTTVLRAWTAVLWLG
mgnify:CR=1 FL=1